MLYLGEKSFMFVYFLFVSVFGFPKYFVKSYFNEGTNCDSDEVILRYVTEISEFTPNTGYFSNAALSAMTTAGVYINTTHYVEKDCYAGMGCGAYTDVTVDSSDERVAFGTCYTSGETGIDAQITYFENNEGYIVPDDSYVSVYTCYSADCTASTYVMFATITYSTCTGQTLDTCSSSSTPMYDAYRKNWCSDGTLMYPEYTTNSDDVSSDCAFETCLFLISMFVCILIMDL